MVSIVAKPWLMHPYGGMHAHLKAVSAAAAANSICICSRHSSTVVRRRYCNAANWTPASRVVVDSLFKRGMFAVQKTLRSKLVRTAGLHNSFARLQSPEERLQNL